MSHTSIHVHLGTNEVIKKFHSNNSDFVTLCLGDIAYCPSIKILRIMSYMESETILNFFESRTGTSCSHSGTKLDEKIYLRLLKINLQVLFLNFYWLIYF